MTTLQNKLLHDTGSEVNVLDYNYAINVLNLNKDKIRKQQNIVKCANNSQLRTKGRVNVKVNIGLGLSNLEFILVENLFPKCIIGIRGLQKLDVEGQLRCE